MSARRAGLGRGLDSLIKPSPEATRSVPIGDLEPNREQPRQRFDEEALGELADSIKQQGIVQPLVVTPGAAEGRFVIIAGERRWRAAQLAGLARVPVVVRENVDDKELLELALVENLQRSDLDPIEEAEAYQSLADRFGLSQQQIAKRVGKARPTVANALRLLNLPGEVRELLASGALTAGQARPLLALDDAAEQRRLAARAAGGGLSAREVERRVAATGRKRRERPPEATSDAHARAAAEALTRRLQTKVEITRRRRGGVISIHFHSEEELIRLYEQLSARSEP